MKAEWSFVVDVARSCGVPEHHCEDIAIEVFLRLERHYGSLQSSEPSVIRDWLRTTTVLLTEEQPSSLPSTSGHRSAATPASLSLAVPAPPLPLTPEEQLIALQTGGSVRALVDALEPDRRAVLVAHVLEGDPIHEVARRLGISEATAHKRLRRAREDLRAAMLRTSRSEERKPGGRHFAIVPLLVTGVALTPGHPATAREWQSPAMDLPQAGPRTPWQSAPRGARWRPRLLLALAASALHRGDLQEAELALHLYHEQYPEDPLAEAHREVESQLRRRTR